MAREASRESAKSKEHRVFTGVALGDRPGTVVSRFKHSVFLVLALALSRRIGLTTSVHLARPDVFVL